MAVAVARRQFTVHEYARMRESGILAEDDRVELLEGAIITMSPIGPLHVGIVNKCNKLLTKLVGDSAIVSVQNPIRLDDFSEPQPDIALLQPRDDFYTDALATPSDVLVAIEIGDSSLEYDREEKLPAYAQSLIREVWIVDVQKRVIEQYLQPAEGVYTQITKVLYGQTLTSAAVAGLVLSTDQVFTKK